MVQFSGGRSAKARDEFLRRNALQGNRPKAALTLDEFWTLHFEPQIVRKKRVSTQKLNGHLFRKHIRDRFRDRKLCDITTYDIQQFVSDKEGQGYSPQTVGHLRNALSKMFGTAVFWKWLDDNPAKGVTLPRMERKRIPRVIAPEEITKLGKSLREPARTLFLLGVLLSLRIGELLGLRIEDVDLESGTLLVRRSIWRGEVGPTKTPGSERRFPLPPQIVELIHEYLVHRAVDSEWLFPTMKGGFHNDRTLFMRYIEPVIKKLGLLHFSWHSMRRTFLTYSARDGVTMPVLQSLAGHSNAQTTLRYIETFRDQKREALEQWASQLFPIVPSFSGRNGAAKN